MGRVLKLCPCVPFKKLQASLCTQPRGGALACVRQLSNLVPTVCRQFLLWDALGPAISSANMWSLPVVLAQVNVTIFLVAIAAKCPLRVGFLVLTRPFFWGER